MLRTIGDRSTLSGGRPPDIEGKHQAKILYLYIKRENPTHKVERVVKGLIELWQTPTRLATEEIAER